jgi:hypothetical protein
MPNWCLNRIYVLGSSDDIDDLIAQVGSPVAAVDFECIAPTPDDLDREPSPEERAAKLDPSLPAWCHWRAKYWGTTGNAVGSVVVREGPSMCVVSFHTAWVPPLPIVRRLANTYPNLTFELTYHEAWAGFSGGVFFEGGKDVAIVKFDSILEETPSVPALVFCAQTALAPLVTRHVVPELDAPDRSPQAEAPTPDERTAEPGYLPGISDLQRRLDDAMLIAVNLAAHEDIALSDFIWKEIVSSTERLAERGLLAERSDHER